MGLTNQQRDDVEKMIEKAQHKLSSDQKEDVLRVLRDDTGNSEISKIIGKKLLGWGLLSLTILAAITGSSVVGIYNKVNTNMENLVADQFKVPRIQEIISDAAKDQASTLMKEQIQPDVNNFKLEVGRQVRDANEFLADEIRKFQKELGKKIQDVNEFVTSETSGIKKVVGELQQQNAAVGIILGEMRDALAKSAEAQNSIEKFIAFQTLYLRAQNDDREAYDQFQRWEDEKNSTISLDLVQSIIANIRFEHFLEHTTGMPRIDPNINASDPQYMQFSQIIRKYESEPLMLRQGYIGYIWKREDYPKQERIQFLIDVLKKDGNLRSVNLAGHYLSKEAGIQWYPFQIKPFVEWWEKEKTK